MKGRTTAPDGKPSDSQDVRELILLWSISLLGAAGYLLTINHPANLLSLNWVSEVCGGQWQPVLQKPLAFLVSLPFRLLPPAARPLALNLSTAAAAAMVLGLLARCVMIWPENHNLKARQDSDKIEQGWMAALTKRFPPIIAAAVLGLNLSFWEQATAATGEIINALVIAWVVYCLLKFHQEQRHRWLALAAFTFGAGMANSAALIALVPAFIGTLIALQGGRTIGRRLVNLGVAIFGWQGPPLKSELTRWRPLGWIILSLAAGLLFYLVMPLAHQVFGQIPLSFWTCLKINLKAQENWLRAVKNYLAGDYRGISLALGSLAPLGFICGRWKSVSAQDSVTRRFLHFGYWAALATCGWVLLDADFSPRRLVPGIPLLAAYFFCALALGVCVRDLLTRFTDPSPGLRSRRRIGFNRLVHRSKKWLRSAAFGLVTLISATLAAGLAMRNGPQIRLTNVTLPEDFKHRIVDQLPPGPKVILSDEPGLLELARLQMLGEPAASDTLFFDTTAAVWFDYQRAQANRYPPDWARAFTESTNHGQLSKLYLAELIEALGAGRTLCCLHQSPSFLFERYDRQPEGLGLVLKPNDSDAGLEPGPSPEKIRQTELAWAAFDRKMLPLFTNCLAQPETKAGTLTARDFFKPADRNPSALFFASYYSRAADGWGVELQKLGRWQEAASQFQRAIQLNDKNPVARINLNFNQRFQRGQPASPPRVEELEPYRNREQAVAGGGPLDEPHYCVDAGIADIKAKLGRQAIGEFDRAGTLEPHNLDAALTLAALYAAAGKATASLNCIQHIRSEAGAYGLQPAHEASLAVIEARADLDEGKTNAAGAALNHAVKAAGTNILFVAGAVNMLWQAGLSSEAIDLLNRLIELNPENPTWLEIRGAAFLRQEQYIEAERDLTRSLEIKPQNDAGRLARANARLGLSRYAEAAEDYRLVLQHKPDAFQASFGLARVALELKNDSEAIRQLEAYLRYAPKNMPEYPEVTNRLAALKKKQ